MEDQQRSHRPPQVTAAAAAVIGGALLLFFSGFDVMNNLQTVDNRARLAHLLGSGGARDFGWTVDDLVSWMHAATLVTGAAAAAAVVLGWFALRRHQGARLGLAAVALVLLVCAPFSGGILAAFVVVAIAMLWSGPARDWFAGRPVRQRVAAGTSSARPGPSAFVAQEERGDASGEVPPAPATPPASTPPPSQGFGDRPVAPSGPAPQQPASYPSASYPAAYPPAPQPQGGPPAWPAAPGPEEADRRPGTVVAACVITWVFSALALAGCAVLAARLGSDAAGLVRYVQRNVPSASAQGQLDPAVIKSALWVSFFFYSLWAVAACVLAVLAWRRHQWARILLVVSALVVGLLGVLVVAFGGLGLVPHVLACAAVVALLLGGRAGRWYQRAPRHPLPPPTQHPGQGRPPRAW